VGEVHTWAARLLRDSGPFHDVCAFNRTGAEGYLARPLGLPKDSTLDSNIASMCDNVTAFAFLRNQGGDSVSVPVSVSQPSLLVAECRSITLMPRLLGI